MTIKNKDGSIFRLQGINPLMKNQDHWTDGWKVYSADPDEIILPDPKLVCPEGYVEDEPLPAIVGVGVVSNKEIIYCKPLGSIIEEDPVYGQKSLKPFWGDQFSFEAIIIESTGLTITFFARMSKEYMEKLTKGSIILVFRERQWWKINKTDILEDGVNIHCIPTDLKPSFV